MKFEQLSFGDKFRFVMHILSLVLFLVYLFYELYFSGDVAIVTDLFKNNFSEIKTILFLSTFLFGFYVLAMVYYRVSNFLLYPKKLTKLK